MAKVALVDEEVTMVQMVAEWLRSEGHQVFPFTNGQSACEGLGTVNPELVIVNVGSDKSRSMGLAVLQKARGLNPSAATIMITAQGALDAGIEALRKGAYDYLERPFTPEELKLRSQRALSYRAALAENVFLRRQIQSKFQFKEIIGTSARVQEVLRVIERVADTESSILICGATGTGKELIARSVHFNSRRRFAPFVSVSCALTPDSLLEAELFGSTKTGFTGPVYDEPGAFRQADGGTIFLDHINALSAALQVRLLRVLQDREVRPVGDNNSVAVDVRILAAAEESLEQLVTRGSFRDDLYRGLSIVPIMLPLLRERAEDIPLLISHFLEGKTHPRNGQPIVITREALEVCGRFEWSGNVRELENVVSRACVLSEDGTIRVCDLPESLQRLAPKVTNGKANGHRNGHSQPGNGATDTKSADPERIAAGLTGNGLPQSSHLVPLKQFLRDQEIAYLRQVLAQVGGCKERAAELLDVSLATIYRKLSESDSIGGTAAVPESVHALNAVHEIVTSTPAGLGLSTEKAPACS